MNARWNHVNIKAKNDQKLLKFAILTVFKKRYIQNGQKSSMNAR